MQTMRFWTYMTDHAPLPISIPCRVLTIIWLWLKGDKTNG